MDVFENEKVVAYIESRQLLNAYKKAKNFIVTGNYQLVKLKKRKPHSKNIWYFRINKKYRAFAILKENCLEVFEISDHQ